MHPGARAAQRFFEAAAEIIPLSRLTHLHVLHWPGDLPSPARIFGEAGFVGTVTAGRISTAEQTRREAPGARVVADHRPTAGEAADHSLLEWPQGREAGVWMLEQCARRMAPEGRVWLFGDKESGLFSLEKRLGLTADFYKGHMRMLSLDRETALRAAGRDPSALLESEPAEGEGFLEWAAEPPGGPVVRVASLPGVFSWEKPDPGSMLLLSALLQREPKGRLLDLGCGPGLLGATLALAWPQSRVVLSDDLLAAIPCARKTVELNGVGGRCQVVAEDGVGHQLRRMRFDRIATHPPFHRGGRTDRELALRLITQSAALLPPGGELWVVGNTFLQHGAAMEGLFRHVETVADDGRFAVWRGVKGRG
ncbi:MAG: class I SAM-dependent methyltransferase [Magnetococcales bacterium]|nr:class I SAM-dependent methyltransferase [Magnetococcales bacterium]